MNTDTQSVLTDAVLTLLRPLIRILLRNGVAFSSFAEIAKKAYVDVALVDFAESGKKQTISRVAALTGLTRKEAKRLSEQPPTDFDASARRYHRATRVVGGWLNDPRFLDQRGQPRTLAPDDEQTGFPALVRDYSGDIPTQAMLGVLEQAGTVGRDAEGRLRLLRHAYIPDRDPADKLGILGRDSAELIATIGHNLQAAPESLRFQRKVSNARLDPAALPKFRELSRRRAQQLLEALDSWLSRHEITADKDNRQDGAQYVSLGIYYYEHPSDKETGSCNSAP